TKSLARSNPQPLRESNHSSSDSMNADLASIADQLRQSGEDASRLTANLSPSQANWCPHDGRSWSIWRCMDHLARVNLAYAPALDAAIASCPERFRTKTTAVSPGWFGRWFIGQMEPPVRSKFKSPAKGVPAEDGDIADALERFLASHKALLATLES